MKKQIILLAALTSFIAFAQEVQPSTPTTAEPTFAATTVAEPITAVGKSTSAPIAKTTKTIAKAPSIRMEIEDGDYIANGQAVADTIKNCKLPKNSPVFIVHSRIVNADKITTKIINHNGEILSTHNGLSGLCSFIDHASAMSKLEISTIKE